MKIILAAAAFALGASPAVGHEGDLNRDGCHTGPEGYHCHGAGAKVESFLIVAVAAAGVAYYMREREKRRQLCRLHTNSSKALQEYDDNGNCRISCKEARRHGIAPVVKDHPAYRWMRDRNEDGLVCE